MKYLLVLLVVVVAVWIWRNNRRSEQAERTPPPPPPPPTPATPAPMLSCRHCGLHLPAADALRGRDGAYCSADHLRRAEG